MGRAAPEEPHWGAQEAPMGSLARLLAAAAADRMLAFQEPALRAW
jgi:hypothetical protein